MDSTLSTPLLMGLIGALVTAVSTSLGALPAMIKPDIRPRTQDILSGFSAGIMLAATAFSLIIPSLEMYSAQGASALGGGFKASFMVLLGGVFLHACNRYVPHEHFIKGREGSASAPRLKRIWFP